MNLKRHIPLFVQWTDMNLEDILYPVDHKDAKMTHQVYNYFYPEREERSTIYSQKFIEKKKYLF